MTRISDHIIHCNLIDKTWFIIRTVMTTARAIVLMLTQSIHAENDMTFKCRLVIIYALRGAKRTIHIIIITNEHITA